MRSSHTPACGLELGTDHLPQITLVLSTGWECVGEESSGWGPCLSPNPLLTQRSEQGSWHQDVDVCIFLILNELQLLAEATYLQAVSYTLTSSG